MDTFIKTPKDRALIKRPKGALVQEQGRALIKRPKGGALVKSTKGSVGLLAMNEAIEQIEPALAISQRLREQWEFSICTIGIVGEPRRIELARKIHQQFLAYYPEIDAARDQLLIIGLRRESIDRETAMAMLNVLFSAIGKQGATLLMAAADMFNPINDVLASAGLLDPVPDGSHKPAWSDNPVKPGNQVEPINRHPAIVAIAIKKLIATAKFTSAAELREAMEHVLQRLGVAQWHLEYMAEAIIQADDMLFEQEPATWKELHLRAGVDVAVERKMIEWEEGPQEEDDEFPATPGSPCWLALDEIIKAKEARAVTVREAACKTPVVKRARKPPAKLPEAAE